MKCKYHKTPKNQKPEFKDCSETGLPCPHSGLMPYVEMNNQKEIDFLCFFAEEVIERQKIIDRENAENSWLDDDNGGEY